MTTEKTLLVTLTGEVLHPARLYYHVFDKDALQRIFVKLNCMEYDKDGDRWVWLYTGKAKRLKFSHRHTPVPKHLQPIVLGSFYLPSSNEAHLDLRSFERATKAVVFFDKHIPRNVASVTDIAVVNRCFGVSENPSADLGKFFESGKVKHDRPEDLLEELRSFEQIADISERRSQMFSLIEGRAREDLPEIERFPVNYYEDGIESLEMALRLRDRVALEHWKGNKDVTLLDVITKLIR
jgi:hypothetical protein